MGTPLLQAQIAQQTWAGLIGAELQKKLRYPWEVQHQGQEDVIYARIAVDRNGNVLDAKIVSSKHFQLLDRATLDLIHRCSPFPPPPASVPGDTVEFDGAVNYFIKTGNQGARRAQSN